MLRLQNIQKCYDRVILNDITLELEPGNIYVLKGISGSGKSTLLNIIGGMDTDYAGEMHYDGKLVGSGALSCQHYAEHIGYVFQHSLLFAGLTNEENLLFFKNDPMLIRQYAQLLGVEELLQQYPSTLSGGERQRFSVIRALVQDRDILLMDEPTASLDPENSDTLAQVLACLKSSGRIILIATHEDCFDAFADRILHIEDGRICEEEGGSASSPVAIPVLETEKTRKPHTLCYVFKRYRKQYKLGLVPLVIILFLLLCGASVQSVFTREAFKKMIAQYPISVYAELNSSINEIKAQYPEKVRVYEDYQMADSDVTACALLDKEDSAYYYQNNIAYGTFPEHDDEIIISQEYAKEKMNAASLESCLNQTISFAGRSYKIVGVLDDPESDTLQDAFSSNIYYCNTEGIQIYLTYAEASRYGTIQDRSLKMIRLDGMNSDPAITAYVTDLAGGRNPSYWGSKIEEIQAYVNLIYGAVLIVVAVVGCISMFFIINDVRLELYYRRKEWGYLRLFGVSVRRIRRIMVYERGIKLVFSTLYALALYAVTLLVLSIGWKINALLPLPFLLALLVILSLFSYLSILIPSRRFLKKSAVQLIQ